VGGPINYLDTDYADLVPTSPSAGHFSEFAGRNRPVVLDRGRVCQPCGGGGRTSVRNPCPSRVRFQWSIVSGSQPRAVPLGSDPSLLIGPMMASGGGSSAPDRQPRRKPILAST
jgi:hypothetical protein